MLHLPAVLYAAIDTGAWSIEQSRAWADRLIEKANSPATWLMNLSIAKTSSEAMSSLMQRFDERGIMLPDDSGELLVGLLYLRFKRGDLSWQRFEAEVADVVDAAGISDFDIEAWTEGMKSSSGEIPLSLKLPLERMGARSSEALAELEAIDPILSDSFFLE